MVMGIYTSLVDLVYEYLCDQITTGELKPKENINEKAICDALDVSRTPVREALIQLSNEGYIEHKPRRGFYSCELNVKRVRDIYLIIGNLEALGAGLALENSGNLDFEQLEALIQEMDQMIQERKLIQYNNLQFRFHDLVLKASNNTDLVRLVSSLKKFFMRQECLKPSSEYDIHSLCLQMNVEHKHILNLLKSKDKHALQEFLREVHWNTDYAPFHTYI